MDVKADPTGATHERQVGSKPPLTAFAPFA